MNFHQHCDRAKAKSTRYMWVVLALFPLQLAHNWFNWTVFTYPLFQSQYWSLVIILPIIMVMVIRRFYLKLNDQESGTLSWLFSPSACGCLVGLQGLSGTPAEDGNAQSAEPRNASGQKRA